MNPQFFQRVAKLIPYPAKHTTVPALAFAYHFEPPADQDNQLGSLFISIEVMAKDALASQVVDLIIKTIGEEYYNKKFTDEPDKRFEKAVAALNTQLAKLHESHHGKQLAGLSAVIGVINQESLYLTQCGKAHAKLYRKNSIIDLASGLNEGSNAAKTFHGIAEGTLKEKDKLFFATPAVMFELETKALDRLIQDNSPATCVQKMNSQLHEDENAARCAALMVELSSYENAADEPLDSNPDTVMAGRQQTKLDNAKAAVLPTAGKATKKIAKGLKRGQHWIATTALPSAKHHSKTQWNKLWTNHINPNPRKALAITAGLVIAIVIGTYAYTSNNYNYRSLVTTYKEVIALTQSAEAQESLGKDEQSTKAIASAKAKIKDLQEEYTQSQIERAIKKDADLSGQQNIELKQLSAKIALIEDKINNVSRLSLNNVVDFSSISGFSASLLVRMDDRLYTVDTKSGTLYQVDPAKKSYVKVGQNEALRSAVAAAAASSGDSIFILTSKSSVWQYSPGKALTSVKLSGGTWPIGNAIASYIGNLYILSPQDKQIYRHSRTSIGFSASSSYIKKANTVDIGSSTALAINGSIIVTDGSRSLAVFTNGIGEQAPVQGLPKSISGLADISLVDESTALLATKDRQRLVSMTVADSGFNFTKQYALPSGSTIQAYTTNDQNQVYILSGKKILAGGL